MYVCANVHMILLKKLSYKTFGYQFYLQKKAVVITVVFFI